jgi:hypothetical protein
VKERIPLFNVAVRFWSTSFPFWHIDYWAIVGLLDDGEAEAVRCIKLKYSEKSLAQKNSVMHALPGIETGQS